MVTVVNSSGGGGGGFVMIFAVAIMLIAGVWFYRQYQKDKQQSQPTQTTAVPADPNNTAGAPNTGNPAASCNCSGNQSCNAFCTNQAAFNLCCYGGDGGSSSSPLPTNDLPEENQALCKSLFNGACNTECGANGDPDECIECNAVCGENVPYTGPGQTPTVPPPSNAGAAGSCNCAGNTYCNQFCYSSSMFNLCCFGNASAAPVYPNTPIPPPLSTGADPTRCKSVYNGSCNTECASGSQTVCNDCMRTCGLAGSGGSSSGRTPECTSKYNGSCNTECSGSSASTCNACRIACGLTTANISRAYRSRDARKVLNNRLYNMFIKGNPEYPNMEVSIDYRPRRVKLSNIN